MATEIESTPPNWKVYALTVTLAQSERLTFKYMDELACLRDPDDSPRRKWLESQIEFYSSRCGSLRRKLAEN